MNEDANTETFPHVYDADGHCIYCDCRRWGRHAAEPCTRP